MTLRYVTGTARAVVRGGTVVVLPGPVEASLVEQVWDQLGTDAGVVEVLQVLTGAFGSSLRTVPPFVVAVVADRRVHVAARGRVAVTLELDGGERVRVEGEGVTTWSERVLDDVVELLVRADTGVVGTLDEAPAGEPLLGGATSLPLVSGVVLAGAVAWPLAERPAPPAVEDLLVDDAPAVDPVPADRPSWGSTTGPTAVEPTPAEVAAPLGATLRLPEETIAPEPESGSSVTPVLADAPATAEPDAAVSPEEDADDDYAHLWGSTILRTVEDAAVRTEDDEEHDEPASPSPVTPPVPPAPDVGEPPLPPPAATGDGLIAGVPREWTGATPAAAHRAATVDPDGEPTGAEGEPGLDHDGHTVHSSAIADLRAAARDAGGGAAPVPPPPSFSAPPGPGQQQILARTCAQGHANPPSRDTCAVCGGPLEGDAELAIRPPLGRVLVSTGQAVELDRPVVVGRRPRTPRSQAADLPRLVTVPSPQQDISRSHLEITLEGWHVLVSDMATTNGTTLLRAGQPPRRLHPSEPVLVVDGDVADLGDGVTLVFEGIR
ncbi:hypothetical protein JOE63_001357 [Cellulosimicrobium cellulans]|uniref:FHA domain-containing protein n=1 Tax=Cellulosimicrobium cellulans TaxID=1710 RepID=UPI0027DE538C|nr:FHA domain-containing protein [Cellulosimicrobium cellulans]MBM7818880.1 hypothetical protein [Cellulosimicrobium cellulans]